MPNGHNGAERSPTDHSDASHEIADRSASWSQGSATLASGTSLAGGRLRIVGKIGYGGTSVLYEARDAERDCHVALKQLRFRGGEAVYALKNEFRALRDVSHPNLVRLHELFAENGACFFTMDLVRGDTFDAWVRPEGKLSETRLRDSLAQLVAAVSAIHAAGKLHRDLKPSNVLVTGDGRVVVLDFGLVADSELGGVGQTLPDTALSGTPAYMAPELAVGAAPAPAIDLYAIGVMLFESLTGKLPFDGNAYSLLFAKQAHAAELPTDLPSDAPADLCELCLKLLSREPAARPSLDALRSAFAVGDHSSQSPQSVSPCGWVGRKDELRKLAEAYEIALSGRLSVVMLAGESGIGKTALCEHFLKRVQSEQRACALAGRCYEHESLPFKAIDPLIDELTRRLRRMAPEAAAAMLPRDAGALVQLFPVLGRADAFAQAPARPMRDPRELQRSAFAALVELFGRLRDRSPLIIHVDDLQWTDADSVTFLRYLFVHATTPPLLFIGSHRGEGTDNPLLMSLLEAARSNRSCRVTGIYLGPLAADDAEQLAHQLLSSSDHHVDQLADSVARESQGSPFFLGELARFATTADASSPERLSLTSLLHARFEPLSARAQCLLEVVALAGCPLPIELALGAAAADHAEVDSLCEARWVRVSAPISTRSIECFHDRIREAVSARLSESRRQQHYAALASALRASTLSDPELLCRLLAGAGDPAGAAQQAVLAATQAANGLAFEHAADLYQRALQLGSFDAGELLTLTGKLGLVLENAGHGVRAASVYERVAALSTGDVSLDYRRRAAEQWLASGHLEQGSALLRGVYDELGVRLPLSGHSALLSRAHTRLLLRVRRGQLEREISRRPSARETMQLRASRSAVIGFIGCLPLQASAMAGQYLLQALHAGDRADRVRAMGFNAYLMSMTDPTDATATGLLARIAALAALDGGAELAGFSSLMHGTSAYNWNRFGDARRHLERCLTGLRGCIGVEWEADAAHVYDQLSAMHAGDHADIASSAPSLIEDAFRRGRRWAGSMLSGYSGSPAWLLADDTDGYRRVLLRARQQWKDQAEQQWPDYVLLVGEAHLAIYVGDAHAAHALLEKARAKRVGALIKVAGATQRWFDVHHGRCAAAALGASVPAQRDPRALTATLAGCEARLARHDGDTWQAFAAMFAGALATRQGDRERALSALRRSLAHLESDRLAMHAAAARRRIGQILDGDRGRALLAEGDSFMRAQSVKNLEATTELYCPGYQRAIS